LHKPGLEQFLDQALSNGVTENEEIVYRYFSYGADSTAHPRAKQRGRPGKRIATSQPARRGT